MNKTGSQFATKKDLRQVRDELKKDIGGVKKDVAGLKKDVSGLKRDVSGLKKDFKEMRNDMFSLKDEILGEIRDTRDEMVLVAGRNVINRDTLEDHDSRIVKLEDAVFKQT